MVLLTLANELARTAGAWGNSLQVSVCPSATAYEETNKTTTNDSSIAIGDTTITLTSGTGFNVMILLTLVNLEDMNTELLPFLQTTLLLLDTLQAQADYTQH